VILKIIKNNKMPPIILVMYIVDLFNGNPLIKSTLSFLNTKLNNVVAIINGITYIPNIAGAESSINCGKYILFEYELLSSINKYVNKGITRTNKNIIPFDFFIFSNKYLKLMNETFEFITKYLHFINKYFF
jgi:hypothetical protein